MANLYLFSISLFMRNFSLGIFFLLFNLYIKQLSISYEFLGLFLAIGNISMSAFSYISGVLIDKYNKNNLLKLSIILSGITFISQIIIEKEFILYIISFCYGIGFIFILNLEYVFSAKLNNTCNINVFNLEKGIGLSALSLGSILGGKVAESTLFSFKFILFISALIYLFSVIPIFFLNINFEKNELKETVPKHQNKNIFFRFIPIFLIFLFLGNTVMLRPFYNLYLEDRFQFNLIYIGSILAIFQIASVFINYLNLKKNKNELKYIYILIFLLIIGYLSLIKTTNTLINISLLICITSLYNLLNPKLVGFILNKYPQNIHGRISGILNTAYNLGDSVSTYVGGILIFTRSYTLLFILISASYFFTGLFLILFFDKKDVKGVEVKKLQYFLESYIFSEYESLRDKKSNIIDCFIQKYETIPYIFLKKNPLRNNFIIATWYMVIYENIEQKKDFESLMILSFERYITSNLLKRLQLKLLSKYFFSKLNIRSIQKIANLKEGDKKYLGFSSEFIATTSNQTDFKLNTYACPLYDFFEKYKMLDALKYICKLDFIRSKYLKSNLIRTKTLADGDELCDFRWRKEII
ncbi:MFS transporter [Cetobacterium sp.]